MMQTVGGNCWVGLVTLPHQCGRLTKCPWQTDPVLNQTFSEMVYSKNSFARFIANSPAFKELLNRRIKDDEDAPVDGTRIRDFQSAKQRFESTRKPAGRMVIFASATLAVALEIAIIRKGRREAMRAQSFIDFFDERRRVSNR